MQFNNITLPYLNIIEPISYEKRKQSLIALFKLVYPTAELFESTKEMTLVETFAYELTLRDAEFNDRLKSVLPIFAKGKNLDDANKNFYGTIRLKNETDEAFLERSQLSLQQSSTAGAEWSYIYHVKSVDSRIVDVLPYRVVAGKVNVTWYANETDPAELALLQEKIIQKLIAEKIKPLGDETHYVGDAELNVNRAVEVPFTVNAKIRIRLGVDGDTVKAEALKALNYFLLTLKIGQDVKKNKLVAVLDVEGVDEVIVASPTSNIAISKESIARLQSVNLTMETLYDE